MDVSWMSWRYHVDILGMIKIQVMQLDNGDGMRMSKVVTTGACHLQLANNHEVGSGSEIGTMGIYRG